MYENDRLSVGDEGVSGVRGEGLGEGVKECKEVSVIE